MSNITIELTRSTIGAPEKQRKVVKALGLHKVGQRLEKPDNASIRGMVKAVNHLVTIVESEGGAEK